MKTIICQQCRAAKATTRLVIARPGLFEVRDGRVVLLCGPCAERVAKATSVRGASSL